MIERLGKLFVEILRWAFSFVFVFLVHAQPHGCRRTKIVVGVLVIPVTKNAFLGLSQIKLEVTTFDALQSAFA